MKRIILDDDISKKAAIQQKEHDSENQHKNMSNLSAEELKNKLSKAIDDEDYELLQTQRRIKQPK